MTTTPSPAAKSKKPPFIRRLFALFLTFLFIAIAGGIVFFARNTAHDLPQLTVNSIIPSNGETPAPAANSKLPSIPDLSPDNMIVVEKSDTDQNKPANTMSIEADAAPIPTPEPSAATGDDIASVKMQLRELEIKLAERSGSAKAATELSESLSNLQKDVLALTEKVAKLEQIAIAASEASKRGLQSDMALLLTISQLQTAIDAGGPFSDRLQLAKNFAGNNTDISPILNELESPAKTGLVPAVQLQSQFESIARHVMQASAKNDAATWAANYVGDGMIANAFATAASWVTIRRTGNEDATSNDIESQLASVERHLAARQWQQASQNFSNLPADVLNQTARDWQLQLDARQHAESALAKLQNAVMARLQSAAVTN